MTEQWLHARQGGLADVTDDAGSTIRAHRLAVGWTQVDAAAAAGISQQHLSQIENGKCLVTFDLTASSYCFSIFRRLHLACLIV